MSHKIGITACSNPMHPSFSADLARLCQILRELGFDPVLSPCLYDNGSGFSGTGAERADALMNLYCDPEITISAEKSCSSKPWAAAFRRWLRFCPS